MTGPVLVAGGAGYIGSHTCKLLAKAGREPVVLDNLSTGHRWAAKFGPLYEGDIEDGELVQKIVRQHGITDVIDFAAKAYVGESYTDPGKYFRENVGKTIHFLDALIASGAKNIVFSSTCAVYGDPETIPITESEKKKPVNPYGETKLFVEKMLHWHGIAHGLKWVAPALLQRGRRRSRRRAGGTARAGNAPDPGRLRSGSGKASAARSLRHRLSDSRRNRRSRLHPRVRSGPRAYSRAGLFARGRGIHLRSIWAPASANPSWTWCALWRLRAVKRSRTCFVPAARAIRRSWWRTRPSPRRCSAGPPNSGTSNASSRRPGPGMTNPINRP